MVRWLIIGLLAFVIPCCGSSVESSESNGSDGTVSGSYGEGGGGSDGHGVGGSSDTGKECDDGEPCTLDAHPVGYCSHEWICGGAGGEGGQ